MLALESEKLVGADPREVADIMRVPICNDGADGRVAHFRPFGQSSNTFFQSVDIVEKTSFSAVDAVERQLGVPL